MDLAYLEAAPDSMRRWAGRRSRSDSARGTTGRFRSCTTLDDATLLTEQQILGQSTPLWRVMQYWLDHAMWTRASVIPYLRLNGVDPPQVTFW
jgi:hypothetical protein